MKKAHVKKALAWILLSAATLCSLTVPAYANSAMTWISGTDATGAMIKDTENPILVEKERLTFDIGELPLYGYREAEDFLAYTPKVTAKYQFYNPSAYHITAKLLFPIGKLPSYAPYNYNDPDYADDAEKYDITVNGQTIEKKVRYTRSHPNESFELEKDLARVVDGYMEEGLYAPDMTVSCYSFRINGVDIKQYPNARVGFDFAEGSYQYRLLIQENRSTYIQPDRDLRVHTAVPHNGSYVHLFIFGTPPDSLPEWKIYKDYDASDGTEIDGEVELTYTYTTPFKDFALFNRLPYSSVSEIDWYNAVVSALISSHESNPRYPLVYCEQDSLQFESDLMRWYEYEITLAAGERITNTVTAPIYPGIDLEYEPDVYQYTYLLSPAKTWHTFGELEILINTPYYLTESSLSGFVTTENGYKLTQNGLPDGELYLTLSTVESPTPPVRPVDPRPFELMLALLIIGGGLLATGGLTIFLWIRKKKKQLHP